MEQQGGYFVFDYLALHGVGGFFVSRRTRAQHSKAFLVYHGTVLSGEVALGGVYLSAFTPILFQIAQQKQHRI